MPRLDLILHERKHWRMLIGVVRGRAAKAACCGEPF